MRSKRRASLLILGVLVVAAAAAAAVLVTRGESDQKDALHESVAAFRGVDFKAGDPDAQPVVAGKRRGLGTPDSYAAQQLEALAYPSTVLKASTLADERNYFLGNVAHRDHAHGSSWQLAGPQTATQPAILNFFDNQASDFQVSGRVTAIALDPSCNASSCRLWIAAAGGGIWGTDDALAATPSWTFLSDSFGTNAIGTLTYDPASKTLYAGTGEPNASGDSEAGVGIYASHDGGSTWTLLPGSVSTMSARSISSIVPDPAHPGTLYVGTTRGVRGVSAVTGGAVSLAPDAAAWGLWKSTDGGQTFSFVWDGHGSARGVNHIEIDSHDTIYAAAFQQGIWRSTNGGSSWEQVFATQDPTDNAARTEFALNTVHGHTRIYVGDGGAETGLDHLGLPVANTGVYKADSIDTKTASTLTNGTANPGYESLTSPDPNNPKWATYDYCEGQCWYDNFVVSPAGHPDTVYVGGSFDYNLYSFADNGKAVLLSTDAGEHWSDQTRDNADPTTGIHPDQHALAVDPSNPLLFFEGSDGGVVHSSGDTTDATANCPSGTKLPQFEAACNNLLKHVPTKVTTINAGLSTLQFQGIASRNSTLIGGTQDNGTWLGTAGAPSWNQTIYGDGGVPAFDVHDNSWALTEFYGPATDANFENGAPDKWVIVDGTFASSGEASAFYKPQIADPVVSGTSFVGLQSIWRTQDFGGDKNYLEQNCPEFSVFSGTKGCGDYAALGGPGGPGSTSDLTSTNYGSDRAGGYVVSIARAPGDHTTLWAATLTGRVFISRNANAPAADVKFTRIDNQSSPNRFVSDIVVDPKNANHAWITYTGYSANTPSTPGHVFEVTVDPKTGKATWNLIEPGNGNSQGNGSLGDLPVTALARDANGTLYIGTDFGVLANKPNGSGKYNGPWLLAAPGLPEVEITDLRIDGNTLYAATHGRALWQLSLQ